MFHKTLITLSLCFTSMLTHAALTSSGQNAVFHTQSCSNDGLLVCLTRISNYVIGDKTYDVIFEYGLFGEVHPDFDDLSVSAGRTTLANGANFLLHDATQYLYEEWNSDYITFDDSTNEHLSDVKAVFATADLSHKSEAPVLITGIGWGNYWGFDAWDAVEYNDYFSLYGNSGRSTSVSANYSDMIRFGTDPEFADPSHYPVVELYLVAREVPLPATAWIFTASLFGLAGIKRHR